MSQRWLTLLVRSLDVPERSDTAGFPLSEVFGSLGGTRDV